MDKGKYTVELGGEKRIFHINGGTLRAFEKLTGKPVWRTAGYGGPALDPDSRTDLAAFFVATMAPENPRLTVEQVDAWIPIEDREFSLIQVALMKALLDVRGKKEPKLLAALTELEASLNEKPKEGEEKPFLAPPASAETSAK